MAEIRVNATGELKLYDSDDSNYVSFKSAVTVSSNVAWTLPSADGSNGQVLQTNGSGTLSFATVDTSSATDSFSITGSTPTLTIGDAGAEDTKIVFDGNAQDWHIGLDDSADDLVIGLGSTLGTTSHIVIDEAGHVTMPLQSAALFYSSNDTQSISSGANRTIAFNAEKYDLNGDYNTSNYTFTAPIAGRYLIQCHVTFNGGEITTNTRNNVGYAVGGTMAYRQFGSSTGSNDRFSMAFSVVQELAASNAVTFIVHLESDDADIWMESSPEKYSWASVTLLC